MIVLTQRQAAAFAPLGIDFEHHPDYVVFDPYALDASAIIIRPDTAARMRLAAARTAAS